MEITDQKDAGAYHEVSLTDDVEASGGRKTNSTHSIFTKRPGQDLEWENFSFSVGEKDILKKVHGAIPAGAVARSWALLAAARRAS